MSRNRLLLAVPALLLLFLAVPAGCNAVVNAKPVGCQQVVFSPESAPAGSHYFGDGSPNMGLSDADMVSAFKQSAACDPFQISVREMIWGLQPIPDEAARFARQQQLAGDLGLLTQASKRVNEVADASKFEVDRNWSGSYETLYAAATVNGWHAFKLSKSMNNETVLKQTTQGGRKFIWKVKCLWQSVARVLRGFPVGPPAYEVNRPTAPPGTNPPHGGTTAPPHGGTTAPPHGGTTVTSPPHTVPPPHVTTTTRPAPGKNPSLGIGNNPGAAGQGDTGPRPGGPTPSRPPVDTQPPVTYGTVPDQPAPPPPPAPGPSQPPVTNPIPTPDTAPD